MGIFHGKNDQVSRLRSASHKPTYIYIYIYITTRDIHSGYVYIAIEAMTIEIVDFPIKNDDFPLFC